MSDPAAQLAEDRALRNEARAQFDANLAQVKGDLEARSIGGRVADKASKEARAALLQGLDVAKESKGVIAGTLAALLLWFFRAPIIAAIQDLMSQDDENIDEIEEAEGE